MLSTPSAPGKYRLPCPKCQKGERDDALEVRVYHTAAFWKCFRCGWEGSSREERPRTTHQPRDDRREAIDRELKVKRRLEAVTALIQRSRPAKGSPAEAYLAHRGLELPSDTPLRFCTEWHWPTERRLPCMVAPIVEITTNEIQAAHLTFIRGDGTGKADVEKARLYMGPKAGGVVKLTPDAEVTYGLAIAEGIETALTGIAAGYPTWSCLDAGNLAAFPVLPGIECLNVLADHDDAGLKAARAVADRWRSAGREVRIITPPAAGTDWNDIADGGRSWLTSRR